MLAANRSARNSPRLESLNNGVRETKAAPCYNLCERTSVAIASLRLRGDWSGECGALLFLVAALPPGRRRFRVVRPRPPASAGRAKSVRHAARTISADRRGFRVAFCRLASGGGRRLVLRSQLRVAGFWPQPS